MIVVGVRVFQVNALSVGALTISMRSLYTPMLVLTALFVTRVLIVMRFRITWVPPVAPRRLMSAALPLVGVTAVLMAPLLYAMTVRAVEGQMVAAPVLWRSSAPGVDLATLVLPNPNHPLAPDSLVNWVSRQPGRYEENVVSIPWVALVVIGVAWRAARQAPSPFWLTIAFGAASLVVGPFLRLAGIETFVPTPWALLRYVPIIGEARMPARFGVIVIMAVAMVFAAALAALAARAPQRRRLLLACVGLVLAFELLPAPRTLYSARIPTVYDTIARDPRPVRVLDLPFGIRDGLSSLGDFSAASLFYQTRHGKPILGGYVSRASPATQEFHLGHPYVRALLEMSAGRSLDEERRAAAEGSATGFLEETQLGYVVIDQGRVSPDFRAFAIETLSLAPVERDGPLHLYSTSLTR